MQCGSNSLGCESARWPSQNMANGHKVEAIIQVENANTPILLNSCVNRILMFRHKIQTRIKQVAAVANNWEQNCQRNLSKSSYWFILKIWFMHIKASWFLNIETWCSKTTSMVTLSYLSVLHPHPSAWAVPSLKSRFYLFDNPITKVTSNEKNVFGR